MTTQSPLSGPMSVGDLLDRAFRLYRARFGVFLLTAAIFLVPVWIIISLVSPDFSDAKSLLIILAFMLANGCAILALSARIIAELHGRTLSIGEGIRRGTRRIVAYAGMSVTIWTAMTTMSTLIAVFAVFYGSIFFFGFLAILPPPSANTPPAFYFGFAALLICGFILLLVLVFYPALYLYSRWLAAPAVLIAERPGPLKALGRSWELSRGQDWRVTGYTVLLFILMALVNILPLALLELSFLQLLPDYSLVLVSGILIWASFLLWTVSTPFYTCAVVLLYYDLRIRNEGYDLELRVAELEAQVARPAGQDAP